MPLNEFEFSWNKIADIQLQLEKLISKNYFLNQSAKEAFKSYVRAYDSHQLKNIFNVDTLDLGKVALSFGFTVPPVVDLSEHHFFKFDIDYTKQQECQLIIKFFVFTNRNDS